MEVVTSAAILAKTYWRLPRIRIAVPAFRTEARQGRVKDAEAQRHAIEALFREDLAAMTQRRGRADIVDHTRVRRRRERRRSILAPRGMRQ